MPKKPNIPIGDADLNGYRSKGSAPKPATKTKTKTPKK